MDMEKFERLDFTFRSHLRFEGSVKFYLKHYKKSFGSPTREQWINNDFIHQLSNQNKYKLRVEFNYWTGGHSTLLTI